MKVLMLNGSPRANGNTSIALAEMEKIFREEGIEVEILHVGHLAIRSCVSCCGCFTPEGGCVFNDIVNEVAKKLEEADGMVVGSPVYYAAPNPTLTALLTRLFYSTRFDKTMKVGASVVAVRRGGASTAFDELNKFFTISGMPVASSQYWNGVQSQSRRGAAGRGRPANYAHAGPQHDLPDEEHPAGQGGLRPAAAREAQVHQLHPLSGPPFADAGYALQTSAAACGILQMDQNKPT